MDYREITVNLVQREGWFHCHFRVNKKLYRKACKTKNEREAIVKAKRFVDIIMDGSVSFDGITLAEAGDIYIKNMQTRGCKSVQSSQINLGHLTDFFGADRLISDIKTPEIYQYRNHRVDFGASRNTCQRELSVLTTCFKLCNYPVSVPKFKESELNSRENYFTFEEYELVHGAAPDHLKPIITFAWISGWRASNILTLKWGVNVKWNEDKTGGVVEVQSPDTKAKKALRLPLQGELLELMQDQWEKRALLLPWVFLNQKRHNRIVDYNKAWRKTLDSVGLSDRVFHDWRRSAATRMDENLNISESVICDIVGWKSVGTFRKYRQVRMNHIEQALEIQDEWLKKKRGL